MIEHINEPRHPEGCLDSFCVGEDGFEPPKSRDSRFTVCPIWPLWNSPVSRQAAGLLAGEACYILVGLLTLNGLRILDLDHLVELQGLLGFIK